MSRNAVPFHFHTAGLAGLACLAGYCLCCLVFGMLSTEAHADLLPRWAEKALEFLQGLPPALYCHLLQHSETLLGEY